MKHWETIWKYLKYCLLIVNWTEAVQIPCVRLNRLVPADSRLAIVGPNRHHINAVCHSLQSCRTNWGAQKRIRLLSSAGLSCGEIVLLNAIGTWRMAPYATQEWSSFKGLTGFPRQLVQVHNITFTQLIILSYIEQWFTTPLVLTIDPSLLLLQLQPACMCNISFQPWKSQFHGPTLWVHAGWPSQVISAEDRALMQVGFPAMPLWDCKNHKCRNHEKISTNLAAKTPKGRKKQIQENDIGTFSRILVSSPFCGKGGQVWKDDGKMWKRTGVEWEWINKPIISKGSSTSCTSQEPATDWSRNASQLLRTKLVGFSKTWLDLNLRRQKSPGIQTHPLSQSGQNCWVMSAAFPSTRANIFQSLSRRASKGSSEPVRKTVTRAGGKVWHESAPILFLRIKKSTVQYWLYMAIYAIWCNTVHCDAMWCNTNRFFMIFLQLRAVMRNNIEERDQSGFGMIWSCLQQKSQKSNTLHPFCFSACGKPHLLLWSRKFGRVSTWCIQMF